MNIRNILHAVSFMLMVVGLAIAASLLVGWLMNDSSVSLIALAAASGLSLATGSLLALISRAHEELSVKEGILVVTAGWLLSCVFGSLPYIFSGVIRDPLAALFETVSGFTTTGASVILDVDVVPKGILFWRAVTHFLGGMGVLVLCVAILPFLGTGGMQIYRAEMTGPTKDRLTPRIASTAKLLWGLYVLLCLAETVFLMFGGMSWFDALCHSFATLATGGFSTYTTSVAHFDSLYIEIVIMVFMLLGATNFVLHLRLVTGHPWAYFQDGEWRFFMGLWLAACLFVAWNIWKTVYPDFLTALHHSFFVTTSQSTTTGFCTVDYDRWPIASKIMLLLMMMIGGCTGSTGGGIKFLRIWITVKNIGREMRLFIQPNAALLIKVGKTLIPDSISAKMLIYVILYVLTAAVASLVMTFFTPDAQSAVSSVIATMGGVGPGLGSVGPTQCYMQVPDAGKAVLILCMLLGRFEFYTLLVLLAPSFWKR